MTAELVAEGVAEIEGAAGERLCKRGRQLLLKQGAVGVIDLLHRGGANIGERDRALLVISWLGGVGKRPHGSTYSLRPEIPGKQACRELLQEQKQQQLQPQPL